MLEFGIPLLSAIVGSIAAAAALSEIFSQALRNARGSLTTTLSSLRQITDPVANFVVDFGIALVGAAAMAAGVVLVGGLITAGDYSDTWIIGIGLGAFAGGTVFAVNSAREANTGEAKRGIAYTALVILAVGIVVALVTTLVLLAGPGDDPPPPPPGEPTPTDTVIVVEPTVTPTPDRLCGDVNQDGIVNAIDAALVSQFHAGTLATLQDQSNADVNSDGEINSVDNSLILQADAGLIDRNVLLCP